MSFPFTYENNLTRSVLTIKEKSFQLNCTYEMYVLMFDDQVLIAKSDTILIDTQSISSFLIGISSVSPFDLVVKSNILKLLLRCVVINSCSSGNEYQSINPGTQTVLQSFCSDHCNGIDDAFVTWAIYEGSMNGSHVQWRRNDQSTAYLFGEKDVVAQFLLVSFASIVLGVHSTKLTVTRDLFSIHSQTSCWSFEVTYRSSSSTSSASTRFKLNEPPSGGTCELSPAIGGNTSTRFMITCLDWTDSDGIRDYSLFGEWYSATLAGLEVLRFSLVIEVPRSTGSICVTSIDIRSPFAVWRSLAQLFSRSVRSSPWYTRCCIRTKHLISPCK